MYFGYGKWIIEFMSKPPRDSELTIIIRHSERPDFKNIPMSLWNRVLLTQRGEEAATEFGVALAVEAHFSSITAHGWGLERCVKTAKNIVDGAISAGSNAVYTTLTDFKSPIENLDLYNNYLQTGKYIDMIEDWFSSNPTMSPFTPYDQYSRHIILRLINEHMQLTNNLTVIVTHDLHILPLLNYVFGSKTRELGFMDGIIISKSGNKLKFISNNCSKNLSCNDLH